MYRYLLPPAVLAALATACAPVRYVEVPVVQAPAAPYLQACATHAAKAQKQVYGSTFRMLQLENTGLAVSSVLTQYVGKQAVSDVYDGTGSWFGAPNGTYGEWRRVHFHCLVSPGGNIVYSYIRPE